MEVLSVGVALVALILSGLSLYENRRNNRVTLRPSIVAKESEHDAVFSYAITNKGLGPAFFQRIEYFKNLVPLQDTTLRQAVDEALAGANVRVESTVTNLGDKTVMAAGETIELVKLVVHPDDVDKLRSSGILNLDMRITYRSSYGEESTWASVDRLALPVRG